MAWNWPAFAFTMAATTICDASVPMILANSRRIASRLGVAAWSRPALPGGAETWCMARLVVGKFVISLNKKAQNKKARSRRALIEFLSSTLNFRIPDSQG